jgi:hypothetical protein
VHDVTSFLIEGIHSIFYDEHEESNSAFFIHNHNSRLWRGGNVGGSKKCGREFTNTSVRRDEAKIKNTQKIELYLLLIDFLTIPSKIFDDSVKNSTSTQTPNFDVF